MENHGATSQTIQFFNYVLYKFKLQDPIVGSGTYKLPIILKVDHISVPEQLYVTYVVLKAFDISPGK